VRRPRQLRAARFVLRTLLLEKLERLDHRRQRLGYRNLTQTARADCSPSANRRSPGVGIPAARYTREGNSRLHPTARVYGGEAYPVSATSRTVFPHSWPPVRHGPRIGRVSFLATLPVLLAVGSCSGLAKAASIQPGDTDPPTKGPETLAARLEDDEATARAEQLFIAGRQALVAGKLARACSSFARSQKLDPAIGTELNLAVCLERRGQLMRARSLFQSIATKLSTTDERHAFASERVAAIEERMPTLKPVVNRRTLPAQLRLFLDDLELDPSLLGTDIAVDPGPHTFVLKSGDSVERRRVSVREYERLDVAFELSSVTKPKPDHKRPPSLHRAAPRNESLATKRQAVDDHDTSWRTMGWSLIVAGGVGLVTSGVMGALILREKGIVEKHCTPNYCDGSGRAATDAGRRYNLIGTAAFALGMAALGGGVVVSVAAAPDGSQASLGLTGRF
jgi:hypothetical protein